MVRYRKSGLTVLELLVAVAVISILLGLLLPATQYAREAARRTTCRNNLRQIGLATQMHHETYSSFPPGNTGAAPGTKMPFLSWQVHLYPYLEQRALWDRARQDYATNPSPFVGHRGFRTVLSTFSCPSDGRAETTHLARNRYIVALSNYLGVIGTDLETNDGVLFSQSHVSVRDIRDGTSNTLIVGERPPSVDFWWGWLYAGAGQRVTGSGDQVLGIRELNARDDQLSLRCPANRLSYRAGSLSDQCHFLHFWSFHPDGAFFLFADGHVDFLSYGAAATVEQMATRAGNP